MSKDWKIAWYVKWVVHRSEIPRIVIRILAGSNNI